MKKYLFGLSVGVILVFTGCTSKDEVVENNSDITSLSHKDILKETTIHDAVRVNDSKLVDFFIQQRIDLNDKDKFGYTPLHLAARFNHFDIAEKLIENGAEVNSVDKYGDTPLIDSVRNGYSDLSKLLICNGAKRDIVDKYEMSPLHYATKTNNIKIAELLRATDIVSECSKKEAKKLITINDYDVINDTTPKICGNIIDSDVQRIQLSFDEGQTVSNAKIRGNKWCAESKTKLENGDYTAMAMAINSLGEKHKVQDELTIHVLKDVYDILYKEFKSDFEKWNAELDADTLTFRFKNPEYMFSRGSSEIKHEYKKILNSFFPRYINTLKKYEDEIINIYVEGHTSSEYRSTKTEKEKFEKNRTLSQKRADAVLEYLSRITALKKGNNKEFLDNVFIADGKSSSELVYNDDGSENAELSRRVEFRIESNATTNK